MITRGVEEHRSPVAVVVLPHPLVTAAADVHKDPVAFSHAHHELSFIPEKPPQSATEILLAAREL